MRLRQMKRIKNVISPSFRHLSSGSQEHMPFIISQPTHSSVERMQQNHHSAEGEKEIKFFSISSNNINGDMHKSIGGLANENERLTQEIINLNRSLEDRDQQLEKVSSELNHITFMQRKTHLKHKEIPFNDLEKNQLFDRLQDTQGKMKLVLRVTQKFLNSMKKLQKAVHNKEKSVQKEKNDFEQLRRELETILANLVQEFFKDNNRRYESPVHVLFR